MQLCDGVQVRYLPVMKFAVSERRRYKVGHLSPPQSQLSDQIGNFLAFLDQGVMEDLVQTPAMNVYGNRRMTIGPRNLAAEKSAAQTLRRP